jgi:hypothetical protein
MELHRRAFLKTMAAGSAAAGTSVLATTTPAQAAWWKKRLTGADLVTNRWWKVAGTDLGIPYVLENGSIGYLFGDTFSTPWPETGKDWRSPVMLRSNFHPGWPSGIVFDSAARIEACGLAPELMHNGHNGLDHQEIWEVSVIPNDAVSFPETGRQIISYMSMRSWDAPFKSNYAGLAYSDNGNDFIRTRTNWLNTPDNTDPYQMWTMQRDGPYVYIFSVRAGRQPGPMMLRRVLWDRMLNPSGYEGWGWNGSSWDWNRPCTPILFGTFGEPSVRRLSDGAWVMAYLNLALNPIAIVTRTSTGPDRVWSDEKVQVTFDQEPNLYGGFIHPWSTSKPNDLHLMVSRWTHDASGASTSYHVSQFVATV